MLVVSKPTLGHVAYSPKPLIREWCPRCSYLCATVGCHQALYQRTSDSSVYRGNECGCIQTILPPPRPAFILMTDNFQKSAALLLLWLSLVDHLSAPRIRWPWTPIYMYYLRLHALALQWFRRQSDVGLCALCNCAWTMRWSAHNCWLAAGAKIILCGDITCIMCINNWRAGT